jgi:hypothetical protein
MNTKTHIVLDTFYSIEEGQETFTGSLIECQQFIDKQKDSLDMYKIRPLTNEEKIQYNDTTYNPN